ncbi:F-box domain [Arabidopsis thaliana x Arabidopsis arenosa]|uniref:F-box domain n=1 Tax=Arabidopsis thaliana x Arabidopsis arenosa TaxID=1240361 RepID=A0A8T2ARB1_9BRAS|nr:F-box domain [Arabidopsis thaliana x Arabidopsis arenosa]
MTTTTTTMANLPVVLVEDILSRVPMTSLRAIRLTCKTWNRLSKNQIIGKKAATKNQFLGFMLIDFTICSMRFDLRGISNNDDEDDDDFIDQSVKEVSELYEFSISQIFHCDGLLLCVFNDTSSKTLMVCNMYLGQTRMIKARQLFDRFSKSGVYAFGYDDSEENRNHKILRNETNGGGYEIYDFRSDSWRVLDVVPDGDTHFGEKLSLSLKGNAYFFVTEEYDETLVVDGETLYSRESRLMLVCFDFTSERFGQLLTLPFHSLGDLVVDSSVESWALSCVREEKLAVLFQHYKTIKIWTTTEIEPNAVSWDDFLEVDLTMFGGIPDDFRAGSFFVDEEKEVAVVFDQETKKDCDQTAYIIGKDGYFKSVNFGDDQPSYRLPLVCSSYVPSLVQLDKQAKGKINKQGKRKERDY